MCAQVLPTQIAAIWDAIRYGLIQVFPPHVSPTHKNVQAILQSILADRAQLWISYNNSKEQKEIHAFAVTCIEVEKVTGSKFLNVWALYAYRHTDIEDWKIMQRMVEGFARANDCAYMTGFSENPAMIALGTALGGVAKTFMVKRM